MKSKIANKVLSGILSVSLLMLQMGMPLVYAAESNPMQETKNITAFADLAEDMKNITVPMGTAEDELPLPKTVAATVERTSYEEVTTGSAITAGTQSKTENVELAVTWESDKPFSSKKASTFTYTSKLTDGSYNLSEGVALPQIKVQVNDKQSNESTVMAKKDSITSRQLTSSNVTPTVDVGNESIYANGTPITIEAGTLIDGVRNSRIKYNNGTSDVYLDLNPNEGGIQQDVDLSSYKIYGGSNVGNGAEETYITMTGGKVCNIYGGGYSSDVSRDTHINISGTAEVSGNIYGGGYGHVVQGTAYISITGGDISQDHAGMVIGGGAEWGTVHHAEIKITGGRVNQVMAVANPGGGNVTGNKTVLITVPVWVNDREFTNALYKQKDTTQWVVKGNVTLTDDTRITIAANETMIVQDGSTLTTNGKLINNGTIIKKGTIIGDVSGTGSIVLTPIVDDVNKAIYANGIPITILQGAGDNQSKISYGTGLDVDFGGNSSKDLREYSIYGGSNTEEKANSNIKMTGGSVKNIYGEGKDFTVKDTTIMVTGGTVSGTIEGGGGNSTANGYIAVVSNGLKSETFDNLFYKEAELKWKIKGEYRILEKDSFYLESNETLEIPESTTLIIRGEFTNRGTIINNGKIIGVAGGNIQGTGVVLTQPIINETKKAIYANGTPLIIEKGSDSEHSRIKYYDGTNYIYLNMENSENLAISGYTINGGAENGEVRKTSIIMNGGNITRIEGGNATESVDIIVTGDVIIPTDRGNISCSNTNENAVSNLFVYYTGDKTAYIPYPISDNSSYGFKNIFCYYPNMPLTEDEKLEIIQGKAVIPKGYTVEISTGKEMTIPRASTLTIEGTLTNNGSLLAEGSISEKSTGTLQGLGIFKKTVFTADDIQAIPDQLYTGNAIMPTVIAGRTQIFMEKVFTVDTSGYTKSYENNTDVGTAKVVFTNKTDEKDKVEKTFNIVKSGTTFYGGIKTYKDNTETNTFNYGDTMTAKVTPKATGTAPVTNGLRMARSFSAPNENQMALFVGETQITEAQTATSGQEMTFIYNTKGANVITPNTPVDITAKYVGNNNMAGYEQSTKVTVNAVAEVTKGETISYAGNLQGAFDLIGSGETGTIKILKDIDLGENGVKQTGGSTVIFDLNGCTVKHSKNSGSAITIYSPDVTKLTVKSSIDGGTLLESGISSKVIDNAIGKGEVTVESGLIRNTGVNGKAIYNAAKFTLKDGTLDTLKNGFSIVNNNDTATIEVTGGNVKSVNTAIFNKCGTVTINGGTILGNVAVDNWKNCTVNYTKGIILGDCTGEGTYVGGNPQWLAKGNVILPISAEIPSGKTFTVDKNEALTIANGTTLNNNGTLLIMGTLNGTGTLSGIGEFKTTDFTADDIQAIPNQTYTGNAIKPVISINPKTIMGKKFTIDISGYTGPTYQKQSSTETWDNVNNDNIVNVGTYRAVYTKTSDNSIVTKEFSVAQANGSISVDGGNSYTINGSKYTAPNTITYSLGTNVTVAVSDDTDFAYWVDEHGMIVSRKAAYTFSVTGPMTLTAVYNTKIENKSTVIFESCYGQVISRTQLGSGDTVTLPAGPTRYGYTFTRWSMTAEEIQKQISDGVAVIKVIPVYELINQSYIITVTDGAGGRNYKLNELVTATANAPKAGRKFSHWTDADGNILSYNTTYQFYATKDVTITANYVADTTVVEAKGTAEIINIDKNTKESKIIFVSMVTVPEGCKIHVAGIIGTDNKAVGTSGEGFNKDNAAYVRGNAWSGNAYRFTWTKKVTADQTWYVRSYLVYEDTNGKLITVYGDMISAGLNN